MGCAALIAGGACSQAPAPAPAKLWTLFDVEALSATGATSLGGADDGLPGGLRLDHILTGSSLFPRQTFSESYASEYVTTEVWANYPQVWTQPMYVPVTGWTGGVPQLLVDATGVWHPVFGVGPPSGFYSPFWQTIYFDVPAGTPTNAITSGQQVLDGDYPQHEGGGRTVPIVPQDVAAASPAGPVAGKGWLNGGPVYFLDFGKGLFGWDPVTNVVNETPIYVFLMRDAEGNLQAPDIPTVAGDGPPGTHATSVPMIDGLPRYASYWRIYTVEVPPTARIFSPDPAQQGALQALGVPVVTLYDPTVVADNPAIVGRIALNPSDPSIGQAGCFDTDDTADYGPDNPTTGHCLYLDSQANVENNIDPGAIQPTNITVTCPFIQYKTLTETPIL